jgi:hypothetical protein
MPGCGVDENAAKFVMNRSIRWPWDVPNERLAGVFNPSVAVASVVTDPFHPRGGARPAMLIAT